MIFREINKEMKEYVETCKSYYEKECRRFPIVTYDRFDKDNDDSLGHACSHIDHWIRLFDTDTWSVLVKGSSYSYQAKDAHALLKDLFDYKGLNRWTICYDVTWHCFYINIENTIYLIRPVDTKNT